MIGISFKQFKRSYPGNYSFNFAHSLSSINSFKVKNYTNFYLTDNYVFNDVFDVSSDTLKANSIYTYIKFGQDYLNYLGKNTNYGLCGFNDSVCYFTIEILDNNICRIYYTRNYVKYYLASDTLNQLYFIKSKLLPFESDSINPQDFTYIFSETDNYMLIFKKTESGDYFITNDQSKLVMDEVISDNTISYKSKPFTISRNIYTYPNISLNTSFITYSNDNTIDIEKSEYNLSNNILLHRSDTYTDIVLLKNQLLQDDVFSCSNNLLSGGGKFVNGLRNYTTISEDIQEETSDVFELNYVFNNKSYKITPGSNYFTSPSSLYPFSKLNINDTKFVSSGSFAHLTPQYADRVYRLSNDINNFNNGQHLLCTWLSGSNTGNKVWVDRYYYPDLITKESALSASQYLQPTYDDYIESLIQSNISLKTNIDSTKFLDKKSDLVFESNQNYRYDRINVNELPELTSTISYCNSYSSNYPTNYFKDINKSGKFTIGFHFNGDDTDWCVRSDHNDIKSTLSITKTEKTLHLSYSIFDQSYEVITTFEEYVNIKELKENFVCFSLDSTTGDGYFFLNESLVKTFKLPIYQFTIKQLIYGDFFVYYDNIKENILISSKVSQPFISTEYMDPGLVFSIPLSRGKIKIDTIYVTLPCGMCNSVDNLEYLQSLCRSSMFKSNNVNIIIKNLNIDNDNILTGVKDSITSTILSKMPSNTQISNIKFENFQ